MALATVGPPWKNSAAREPCTSSGYFKYLSTVEHVEPRNSY